MNVIELIVIAKGGKDSLFKYATVGIRQNWNCGERMIWVTHRRMKPALFRGFAWHFMVWLLISPD